MACRCDFWNGEYGTFYKTCGSAATVERGRISPVYVGLIERDRASGSWAASVSSWMRPSDMGRRPPGRRANLGVHATKDAAKRRVEAWLKAACESAHGPGFSGRGR